jgi:hypothetical protein
VACPSLTSGPQPSKLWGDPAGARSARLVPSRPGYRPCMRPRLFTPLVLLAALLTGCSSGMSASGGSNGSAGSAPASQPPASTGGYVPAAGTDKSGALFQTYSDHKLGYHLLYPGGWNVSHAKGVVRIAKLGNVIVITSRDAKFPPKLKGVRAALKKQQKSKAIVTVPLPPRTVKLGKTPAIKMAFTKQRPASDTAPAATLNVYRYLVFHDGHIVILSLQSPDTVDNRLAYQMVADSFGF